MFVFKSYADFVEMVLWLLLYTYSSSGSGALDYAEVVRGHNFPHAKVQTVKCQQNVPGVYRRRASNKAKIRVD